jgi:phthiocerol/phenolphthiocerol synthesis type-I polyketide synthase E
MENLNRDPLSELDEFLVTLWSSLLGKKHIGLDDSFLELGGDSLMLVRMLVEASARFSCDPQVDYDRFFAVPTIRTLSEILTGHT